MGVKIPLFSQQRRKQMDLYDIKEGDFVLVTKRFTKRVKEVSKVTKQQIHVPCGGCKDKEIVKFWKKTGLEVGAGDWDYARFIETISLEELEAIAQKERKRELLSKIEAALTIKKLTDKQIEAIASILNIE